MKRLVILFVIIISYICPAIVLAGSPPDQQKSSISGAATPANGTSWSSVTIVLRDANGNNLTAHDWISITSSSSTTSFDPSTATLDGSGTIYTKMRSTTVGNVPVTVTDNTTSTQITGTIVFYTPGTNPPTSGTCTDAAPGSAPSLSSAVSSDANSVSLTWTAAVAPVTYYLLSYGTASGNYQYGNPNVGGQGTTTYTVGGLTTGTKYYFVVRAVNGCTPGNYSNELSASAGSAPTPTPVLTQAALPTPTPVRTQSAASESSSTHAITTPKGTAISPTPGSNTGQLPAGTPIPPNLPAVTPTPTGGLSTGTVVAIGTALGVLITAGVGAWLYTDYRRSHRPPPITYD